MNANAYTPMHIQDLINRTAMEANILPLTSRCDSACIFCSHQNNPPQVQVIYMGERSLEDILDTMQYLDAHRTITIGESATNIIEGEPTSHRDFKEIIRQLRRLFPLTPVSMTTNGHHLNRDLVDFLSQQQPVYVNLSLNSSSVSCHRRLMRDTEAMAECAIASIELLDEYHIPFSCSMVGMPNITGFDDIRRTIQDISRYGADSIQLFMPGFSSHTKKDIFPNPDTIYRELKNFVDDIAPEIDCPVLLEPSYVQDLRSIVSGIRKGSPAWEAGIRRGDEIISVNDQIPYSRVDAYGKLNGHGMRIVKYRHQDAIIETSWTNTPDGSCGITMEYDFDRKRALYMEKTIASAPGKVLMLSSEFAHPLIQTVVENMAVSEDKYDIICTPNITFGGTIRAAGLLCCDDYIQAIRRYLQGHEMPGALAMPGESFNYLGRDLTGRHYTEIGRAFHLPVALV
ncbi:MAG: radical SAM protein [Coprococcus sp.]